MSSDAAVDARNPWLGLASFTEETRAYFFGRDEEVAELARRVQRKLLTVLFGQSGLGKTSILRAGLVPRLRVQGYCPVYVRIDYSAEAPSPADQIKRAIAQSARRSGEWTQAGVAVEGESLWEFLHHRDDVLQDESGATLIPLLIFDQFEEIFTVAQSDDAGRARAARFISDLADLVENRPPRELEAALEADESAAEKFDFARGDYRVLIALREDYLAPLEGLKGAMPSIAQNRLRLAPMTGKHALAAVLQPGKGLVTEEVASAIVRFVAGGAEIANAEVEPSLLSLICRELNDTRIAQGRAEISLDLLDGSQSSILSNFYERSLADQPAEVRRIIEDQLLTASGFRENIAEERLVESFKAAGAAPGALALLVNRRLLRIEERLDVRRVELTHDVLCGVVKASRDLRREREEREATARLLDEQRAREAAARKALVHARQIAVACGLLALFAIVAAGLAVLSNVRAHHAEAEAQQTRTASDQARGQAEHLLSYLTDDFARELEAFGRLDAVAQMAKQQMDYFAALPPALKGNESTRNAVLAMAQYSRAKRRLGDMPAADAAASDALRLAEGLKAGGDDTEATRIALAWAYAAKASVLSNSDDPQSLPMVRRAAQTLETSAMASGASIAARRTYGFILVQEGFEENQSPKEWEHGVATLQRAQELAVGLGAKDLKDFDAAVIYAESGAWLVEILQRLGRHEEARAAGLEASAIASKTLELRPTDRRAMMSEQVLQSDLAGLDIDDFRPLEALPHLKRSLEMSSKELALDPNNVIAANNMAVSYLTMGDSQWVNGQVHGAIDNYQQALALMAPTSKSGAWFILNTLYPTGILAWQQADAGNLEAAQKSLKTAADAAAKLRLSEPKESAMPILAECYLKATQAQVAMAHQDAAAAQQSGRDSADMVRDVATPSGFQRFIKRHCVYGARDTQAQAEYLLADFKTAEATLRAALEARKAFPTPNNGDRREIAMTQTLLALAIARQGRLSEAAQIIDPIIKVTRELATRNHGDHQLSFEFAASLYVQALSEPARRTATLQQAAALIDGTPAEMRNLQSVRLWRSRIREAQGGHSGLLQ